MSQAQKRAFTLVELLITMVVSALVINGVVMSLINSMVLNEYNQEFSIAMNIVREKLEEAMSKKSSFATLIDEAGTLTAATNGINGLFRIDVDDVIAGQLKNVKVAVCWRTRSGRIIGDCNWNGTTLQWDAGFTPPNYPSSPCSSETAVAAR